MIIRAGETDTGAEPSLEYLQLLPGDCLSIPSNETKHYVCTA